MANTHTTTPAKVTAIVLTCNRPTRCVDSVWHNTLAMQGLEAETIVVNNGVETVSLPPAIAGIPCRVIQMPANIGAAARNAGIRAATGEILLVLDDDAYMDPLLARKAVDAFSANPGMGALAFSVRNGKEEDEACLLPSVFHGCACGFRKSAIVQAGGYPDDYLYYGEEYDVAFRLYGAGYSIGCLPGPHRVRHVRDQGGRNTARIIQLLVQNNTKLLWTHFPKQFLWAAFRNVLQRYRLVAGRENVLPAYLRGLRSVPSAMLRGMLRRKPMDRNIFRSVVALDKMELSCRRLWSAGAREVVVCGVGKFPSLWLAMLKRYGLRVRAILDANACWRAQCIGEVPVVATQMGVAAWLEVGLPCLVGTASAPENERWRDRLMTEHDYSPALPEAEFSSAGGIIDLLDLCRTSEFWPKRRAIQSRPRRGIWSALDLHSDDSVESPVSGDAVYGRNQHR
ncbi:MAG: glycosyltransferase [bacterium]